MFIPFAHAPPVENGRRFYGIAQRDDGTVDVYLRPADKPLVVRGVVPWDDLENDVRTRYEAWCAIAEAIPL